jgi:hypothetical protein
MCGANDWQPPRDAHSPNRQTDPHAASSPDSPTPMFGPDDIHESMFSPVARSLDEGFLSSSYDGLGDGTSSSAAHPTAHPSGVCSKEALKPTNASDAPGTLSAYRAAWVPLVLSRQRHPEPHAVSQVCNQRPSPFGDIPTLTRHKSTPSTRGLRHQSSRISTLRRGGAIIARTFAESPSQKGSKIWAGGTLSLSITNSTRIIKARRQR